MLFNSILCMDYIIGHENMDFDCVASMVAVNQLHPEAIPFLQPTVEGSVKEFLNLYRDDFSFHRSTERTDGPVDALIVVDTNRTERLGPYEGLVERAEQVIVYDHHPGEGNLDAPETYNVDAGALISSLVLTLHENGYPFSPRESTLYMLGLHQETGSLLFENTTITDYEAGCVLVKQDVQLSVVRTFYHHELEPNQLEVLTELMNTSHQMTIRDVPVTLATAEADRYVPEAALLTRKLQDLQDASFLVSIVRMKNRLQVVFRNRFDHLDAGAIAGELGGGGHARAASAVMKDVSLDDAKETIQQLLSSTLRPGQLARDIMSSPVKTVSSDCTMSEVQQRMLADGVHGFPIVDEEGHLSGIITQTDLEKARSEDLLHAPVSGFKNEPVITITPKTGLQNVMRLMMDKGIGRLPVLQNNKLVGMVTRTDVIQALHAPPEDRPEER